MKQGLVVLVALLLGMAVGAGVMALRPQRQPAVITSESVSHVTVHDTVVIERPVPVTVTEKETVTVELQEAADTTKAVAVLVPIETKVYEDSAYRAVISGYHASLDTLEVFVRRDIYERTVTVKAKQRRWGVGVGAGYAVTRSGLQPYIGVGISYRIFDF